ncbi:hypothetical protein ACFZAV_42660 [Streptomyces sp. NPDC008343]|uniref:hypothetical protein n=1 Tax=Streptomyces sp. NPDC008343 TaxID=3364828 RepID=UPI0036E42DBB
MTAEEHPPTETGDAGTPDPPAAEPSPAPQGRGRRGGAGGADILARLTGLGAAKKTTTKKTAAPAKKATAKKAPAKKATAKKAPATSTRKATAKKVTAPAKKAAPDNTFPVKKKGDWVTPVGAAVTMPAEQDRPRALYSARITFTTTEQQRKALEEAKITDRIDKTARLRAMVALWEQDERLRKRVDKLAQTMQ